MLPTHVLLVLAAPTFESDRAFKLMSYADTIEALKNLAEEAPELISIGTAQGRWGIPSPGTCGSHGPCEQWYAVITNQSTYANDPTRPEVFFSGAVHGNEQVGPTAVVELATLLVENHLHGANKWLQRLVQTRAIWIMPSANAKGFHDSERTENGIDPNRDFAYGQDPAKCMVTTAARAINELYREHLFQLALTFHGGMVAIGYEWGSYEHRAPHDRSPDDAAMHPLGQLMKQYASGSYYEKTGPMNSYVYPVHGGMEDWAYAASWDTGVATVCKPSTFGGYPASKTQYTPDMLRTFNYLVETSRDKIPHSSFGDTDELLVGHGSTHDGHIARNVRLCLLMTDLVEPYVEWANVQPDTLMTAGDTLDFDVGGALKVDKAFLHIKKISSSSDECPQENADRAIFDDGGSEHELDIGEGDTIWSEPLEARSRANASPLGKEWSPLRARYSASLKNVVTPGISYVVAISAVVDQDWAHAQETTYPSGPPQAHVVKARTIEGYSAENAGRQIRGRLKWFSNPRCIDIASVSSFPKTTESTVPIKESSTEFPKFTLSKDLTTVESETSESISTVSTLTLHTQTQSWTQMLTSEHVSTRTTTLSSESELGDAATKTGDDSFSLKVALVVLVILGMSLFIIVVRRYRRDRLLRDLRTYREVLQEVPEYAIDDEYSGSDDENENYLHLIPPRS